MIPASDDDDNILFGVKSEYSELRTGHAEIPEELKVVIASFKVVNGLRETMNLGRSRWLIEERKIIGGKVGMVVEGNCND